MINNYNEFLNEKLTDNLKGFDADELKQQFLNGEIDIEKHLYNCEKYNLKIDNLLIKKLIFDGKINIAKYYNLSKQYNIILLSENELKKLLYDNKILIDEYIIICEKYNYKIPTRYEIHKIISKYNPIDMLYYANSYNFNDLVKLSIKNGADIHEKDERPLRTAIKNENIEIIKLLINNGANIHIWDDEVLNVAIKTGNIELTKYLVENGCKIVLNNINKAVEYNKFEIFKYLYNNLSFVSFFEQNILIYAIKENDYEIVKFLLDNNVKLNNASYKEIKNISSDIKKLIENE